MHVAEKHDIEQVFTVDMRHFSVFRRRDGRSLKIVPAE